MITRLPEDAPPVLHENLRHLYRLNYAINEEQTAQFLRPRQFPEDPCADVLVVAEPKP